jgi:hypothetical protein
MQGDLTPAIIFESPGGLQLILMTNGIGGLIPSPILDILMGFLSSIIVTSIHSILTSYFFILTILSS